MKCEYCGSELLPGNGYCPFCGLPVSDAELISTESAYQPSSAPKPVSSAPARTKSELKVPLITLCILIVLNIAGAAFAAYSWDISYSIREWQTNKNLAVHMEQLQSYLNNRDYIGYHLYYYEHSLYTCSDLDDYYAVSHTCTNLYNVYDIVTDFSSNREYYFAEERLSHTAELITNYVNAVFSVKQNFGYDDVYFTPDKTAIMEDVRSQLCGILVAYCGLTREEASQLPDFSHDKLYEIIERGLQRL